jgi:hypothetical protein
MFARVTNLSQSRLGPIPGAGLLSYLAPGLTGLGSMGWKRLRVMNGLGTLSS